MFDFFNKAAINVFEGTATGTTLRPVQQHRLPAPRTETDQLKEFEEGLRKLDAAIHRNKGAREQLAKFQEMGTWDSLWGGLTGQNDKDMAKMLAEFGASLETTQSVVQLLTQLHTANNNVLRSFNDALVRKIESLQSDSETLEGNQNGSLVVLCEFKRQIDDLLALYDGYERCSRDLERLTRIQSSHEAVLKDTRSRHESRLASQGSEIQALDQKLLTATQTQAFYEADIRKILSRQEEALTTATRLAENLSTQMAAALNELSKKNTLLTSQLNQADTKLNELLANQQLSDMRIELIEQNLPVKPSWIQRMRQQSVALGALIIALAALAMNVRV